MNLSENITGNLANVAIWGVDFSKVNDHLNYLYYNKQTSSLTINNYNHKVLSPETFMSAKQYLDEHLTCRNAMHLHISLTRLNASSVKGLLNLFNTLNHAWRKGKNVSVSWMTPNEEEEIFDLAYDFSELYDFDVDVMLC